MSLYKILALVASVALAHSALQDEEDEINVVDPIKLSSTQQNLVESDLSTMDNEEFLQMPAEVPKKDLQFFIENYQVECLCIVGLFACVVICYVGSTENKRRAQAWHNKMLPILKQQFAVVGHDDGTKETDLETVSFNEYSFYASGRKNCYYALIKLQMLHRQCVLSTLAIDKLYAAPDTLAIDIPIRFVGQEVTDPAPFPLEFFLTKQSGINAAFRLNEHFKDFLSLVRNPNLISTVQQKDQIQCLAESEEACTQIIDREVGQILQKYGDALIDLHITDRQCYNQHPLFLRARISIDDADQTNAIECLKAVFLILDKTSRINLNQVNRQKAERIRKKVVSEADQGKVQEKEREKDDKLRVEQEAYLKKLRALPLSEQRKLEDKKRKADLKNQKAKMSKMVKF